MSATFQLLPTRPGFGVSSSILAVSAQNHGITLWASIMIWAEETTHPGRDHFKISMPQESEKVIASQLQGLGGSLLKLYIVIYPRTLF